MGIYAYYILFSLGLFALGYGVGSLTEKKHYRSITNRERAYLHLPAITTRTSPYAETAITSAKLVCGSAVISVDYFKRFLARIRNIFGGTVKSYESLIDRARRESILRMKEMAKESSIIINVRIETSTIGNSSGRNNVTCLEAIAYGTALFVEK